MTERGTTFGQAGAVALRPDAPAVDREPVVIAPAAPPPMVGKRIFDIAFAASLLVATAPLVALAALASSATFRASPFFRQQRVGIDGRPITVTKIRTLPTSTAADADKYALADVEIGVVGRLLRATHLDELPQLVAVVRGDMSMVGPRPEMPVLAATYPPSFVARRTQVRPGVTGLWQISDASGGLIGEAPEFDEFYVTHRSWKLDRWILRKTAAKMLRGETVTFEQAVAERR